MKLFKKSYWKIFWIILTLIAGIGLVASSILSFLLYS